MLWLRKFEQGTGLTQTSCLTTQDRGRGVQEQHPNNITTCQSETAGTQAYPQ